MQDGGGVVVVVVVLVVVVVVRILRVGGGRYVTGTTQSLFWAPFVQQNSLLAPLVQQYLPNENLNL